MAMAPAAVEPVAAEGEVGAPAARAEAVRVVAAGVREEEALVEAEAARVAFPVGAVPVAVAEGKARSWRVEADFIDSIRGGRRSEFTDFAQGVRYMEFTEAVARSAQAGRAVTLPLEDVQDV